MENKMSETKLKWKIEPKYALFIGVGILIIALSSLYGLRFLQTKVMSKQLNSLPQYGWHVSEDLGIGDFSGDPDAQCFVLTHHDGWQAKAYSLDPQKPAPEEGKQCSLDGDTFWCGDNIQELREYEIVQQLSQPEQPTAAHTATHTSTPTPTHTPTSTSTNTPTSNPTSTPTNTPMPTQTVTPTARPKMGGGGNLGMGDVIRFAVGTLFFAVGAGLAFVNLKKFTLRKE